LSREYFGIARREILPHLPAKVERMLELGCGNGATAALVKAERKVAWAGGVEVVPDAAEKAKAVCDQVWLGDIERMEIEKSIPPESLDLILCLDVLEHLVDPWTVVKRITPLLGKSGRMIVSIPNIRHYKFIRDLLFKGKFRYADAGLLDRTHLRFFVRETAVELVEAGGLKTTVTENAQRWPSGDFRSILSQATFGRLDGLMVKQWLIVAERRP
jgi:2-polyprenyl-3-methyl-5-hydroxy-6-metoxy-1,4-benzoquinol methylase